MVLYSPSIALLIYVFGSFCFPYTRINLLSPSLAPSPPSVGPACGVLDKVRLHQSVMLMRFRPHDIPCLLHHLPSPACGVPDKVRLHQSVMLLRFRPQDISCSSTPPLRLCSCGSTRMIPPVPLHHLPGPACGVLDKVRLHQSVLLCGVPDKVHLSGYALAVPSARYLLAHSQSPHRLITHSS